MKKLKEGMVNQKISHESALILPASFVSIEPAEGKDRDEGQRANQSSKPWQPFVLRYRGDYGGRNESLTRKTGISPLPIRAWKAVAQLGNPPVQIVSALAHQGATS
ncbi:MAG: hypothetical protein U1E36_01290 [Rickettsiales bacterium]